MDTVVDVFNLHHNVTADGVVIVPGLRVFTNEMEAGVVTEDREQGRTLCCGNEEHLRAQVRLTGWFTDHAAGQAAAERGCGCRHNHWFNVKYDNGGGGMFDGERMATTFQGRKA